MIEASFSPDRTGLIIGIIILLAIVVSSSWLVYQLEVKQQYKQKLKAYKPLVSMLGFFSAFICLGIFCFNCWNFLSLKPVHISNDYIEIEGEQIRWENILSVENKLIDEVGLFGNIKATDERILEIRKVGKIQAPVILSANFYPVEEIYQQIKAKKD
jgi:hypothetical protein